MQLAHGYISFIVGNGGIPIITKSTSIMPDSNHLINSYICDVDITDHYLILCRLDKRKSYISKTFSNVFYLDKSKFTAEIFYEDLG